MSTNKNAIIRYNTLDKCFRNTGRKYYFDDLLEKVNEVLQEFEPGSVGIKTRQLRDDMRFMKSEAGYAAPIIAIKESKKAYYRYDDPSFSINNSPLNETEAEQMKSAIAILQRFEGAVQFEWMNEIGPLLSSHFGLNKSERKVMSYDTNIDYTGYDKITPIFNAIVNKRVLIIEYEPFDKEPLKVTFHPHYLKQYNNRWFVFGLNEEYRNPLWNMALDRINNIRETSTKYKDTKIDWEEHFYDIIGVTTPNGSVSEKIELVFSKEQANYIETKPLHPSQKSKRLENGDLHVSLKLIPNYELEMKLLSFGEKVKVVKPEKLINSLASRLKSAANLYK